VWGAHAQAAVGVICTSYRNVRSRRSKLLAARWVLSWSRVVKAKRVVDTIKATLHAEIKAAVEKGSTIYTDAHSGYGGLATEYVHEVVDHAAESVRGKVHTNGKENFWSSLKRSLKGTYVSVMPVHLDRYVDGQAFPGGRFGSCPRYITLSEIRGTTRLPFTDRQTTVWLGASPCTTRHASGLTKITRLTLQ